MNLSLLKKLHKTLPESGIGHFTMEHVEQVQSVLEQIKPKIISEVRAHTIITGYIKRK